MDRDILSNDLIQIAQRLEEDQLVVGTAGNVSVRYDNGFLITPSSMAYKTLKPTDIVSLNNDGISIESARKPSSEWRFHRDIYLNRPDISAVLHTHSPYATTLACLNRDIPPFHYMIAMVGGDTIRCADYALFGTQALSDKVIVALQDRQACLLANHGMIACGGDLTQAYQLALEVEYLSRLYYQIISVGQPVLLDKEQMAEVLKKFASYRNNQ